MGEEILCATLDGNIPLQEVLTWIADETCGPSLQENLTCSRGDFVLCILNFLRESTERAWQQSATFQSPIKSVKKSAKINNLNRQISPQKGVEKKFARRVELFPTGATSLLKSSDQDKNLSLSRTEADIKNDNSFANRTHSPNVHSPSPFREAMDKCSVKLKEEENPFLVSEVSCLATSSPLSVNVTSDISPQHTPVNRRVHCFKSNERCSPPVGGNSPDYQFKTPSRGSTMCLGDFLIKGGKSQQPRKRFSPSPTSSLVFSQNSSPVDQSSQSLKKKHKRRINPTKVSLESTQSSSQNGFQEMEGFGSTSRPIFDNSPFKTDSMEPMKASPSFSEERYLLKQERLKLQNQGDNPVSETPANCPLPTKSTLPKAMTVADPLKVTNHDKLLKLSEMYCCVLNANLVPNLMSELYFLVSLLVIQSDLTEEKNEDVITDLEDQMKNAALTKSDGHICDEIAHESTLDFSPVKSRKCPVKKLCYRQYFYSVHNCVFFATSVLLKEVDVLGNFDRITLKLLLDNERIAVFSPKLKECLLSLYSNSVSRSKSSQGMVPNKAIVSGNVSFQSDTDNSSNFPSAQCFSNFRKQRDGFYEILRIWEANYQKSGWNFAVTLGNRVRSLLHLCSDPINLMHFARLFRLQLLSSVSGASNRLDDEPGDLQFLEGLRGIDPDKLNRLKDRLVTPYKAGGPRPEPSFPNSQEFYRDFILSASHLSFLQHLQDSFISHLLELDQTPFLASDTEDCEIAVDNTTRHNYLSCMVMMRLLAKFLGLIVFLPYTRTDANLPHNIRETEVSVRSKVMPPLDILRCVVEAHKNHRLIVTVPWVVKFLGMMDPVSAALPAYQTVIQLLLRLYMDLRQGTCGSLFQKSWLLPTPTVLLLRLSLGWLFEASFIQETIFYSWCFNLDETLMLTLDVGGTPYLDVSLPALDSSDGLSVKSNTAPPVDALNLIDCEVLYALCPFLMELRSLLASTPSECAPGGTIRHITPVSAGSSMLPLASSGKQLELRLEDSFFHGLPASVLKTVEFVVERVTSSCVKHICNVWLPSLKQKGVQQLQEKIKSYETDISLEKDSSVIQSELKTEINSIIDQVSVSLKAKCRTGVAEFCLKKCKGALFSLLSEESLSVAVCEMCVKIASRMSEERVISWMQNHATLTIYSKDLQSETEKAIKSRERCEVSTSTAKTSHIAPGASASWKHDDSAPSPFDVLHRLKLLVCDILNGQDTSRENVDDIVNQMEQCVTKRQDVVPAAERILALLSVDLIVSLVCHNPRMVDSNLLSRMVSLWKLDALRPVEDGLARLVCPRNMLLLAQSSHQARLVWEKLAEVVAAVLKANLVTPDLVENQCLAIMQQEWPQNILRCFAMCMNEVVRQYQKQKDVDYKFVLLLEWLAETMAQIDYFPHL